MKKTIAVALFLLAAVGAGFAQNYMVVDSEKIFKSIDEYNRAITQLDDLSAEYRQLVDAKFSAVETLYNNYQAQKANLSSAARRAREDAILAKEQEAIKYQEDVFGAQGELMKRRLELIQPIQERVFKAIAQYAQSAGYELVLDLASNPTLLYYAPSVNMTEKIIGLLK